MIIHCSDQEHSVILAGLRALVKQYKRGEYCPEFADIVTNGGVYEPMAPSQVDELCERLNFERIDVPMVCVKLNDGVVQGTVTNVPGMDVLVLDYDVEHDDNDYPSYPEKDGSWDPAAASYVPPLVDAPYMRDLQQLADKNLAAQ